MDCSTRGCDREAVIRGVCRKHYASKRKSGEIVVKQIRSVQRQETPIADIFRRSYVVDPATGCWNFKRKYKLFWIRDGSTWKGIKSSHLSLKLLGIDVPKGKQVNHGCNNAFCGNPDHLYVGTQFDNIQDGIQAGVFGRKGEQSPASKLTEEQVIEIRGLIEKGVLGQRTIAKRFGICQMTVSLIGRRKIWSHI